MSQVVSSCMLTCFRCRIARHGVLLLLAGVLLSATAHGAANSRPSPLVGKPAPAFQLSGASQEDCSIEAFKGHILVMQFGASW